MDISSKSTSGSLKAKLGKKMDFSRYPNGYTLREYPDALFYLPLYAFTIFAWAMQYYQEYHNVDDGAPISWVSLLWLAVFLFTTLTVGFSLTTEKILLNFFVVLSLALSVLLLFAMDVFQTEDGGTSTILEFNLNIEAKFYVAVEIIFTILMFVVFSESRMRYLRFEKGVVYYKTPYQPEKPIEFKSFKILRLSKDVMKQAMFRADDLTIKFDTGISVTLHNVVNAKKREANLREYLWLKPKLIEKNEVKSPPESKKTEGETDQLFDDSPTISGEYQDLIEGSNTFSTETTLAAPTSDSSYIDGQCGAEIS